MDAEVFHELISDLVLFSPFVLSMMASLITPRLEWYPVLSFSHFKG